MDIYSAKRRLSRPFVVDTADENAEFPIEARGMIGDGLSVALVRVDGVIDWLCWPRFDSPSVFGALLDQKKGGLTAISPVQRPFESDQIYDPDTNVLETLFTVPGQGVVRVTDFMPWTDDPRAVIHEVHRRVECVEGAVDLRAVFDPRFDFGRQKTDFEMNEHGVLARCEGGERVSCVLSGGSEWKARSQGGLESVFRLPAGQRRWMVLSWGAERPEHIIAYRPFEHLRVTRRSWRAWAQRVGYDGPWRHHVVRSALALKLMIYAPTGAMIAAPTTSLPEWIGGPRNWDYRYVWTRDAAMSIGAMNALGYVSESRDFFHFMRDTLARSESLPIMYTVDGAPVPDEAEIPELAGYAGSKPVRVGNGARDQVQRDTAGALINAAHLYEQASGSLTLRVWRHMREIADHVRRTWQDPDHGMWEPRTGMRHNVHSKLMSWLALDRASKMATLFGDTSSAHLWSSTAELIREDICEQGLDPSKKHFVASYGGDHADASLLLIPIHGMLSPTDPRVLRTLDWVREKLSDGPFLYRYLGDDDGLEGGEGAFILCGFWLAEALAMAGRIDEAQEVFTAHANAANHLGLLAEEIDPKTHRHLGNYPQAFSHLGLINAAMQIDKQLRLRDEGAKRAERRT